MTKVLVTNSSLEDIADAIRAKNGSGNTYKPGQMAAAIQAIVTPELEALSITQNGSYTPSSGKNGFSSVAANVPNSYAAADEGKVVSSGALVAQTARSETITINGTYDTTENNSVTVNVAGGGGGISVDSVDYVSFASKKAVLPFTVNGDYEILVDFETNSTASDNIIIGSSGNYNYPHVTIYSNKFYVSTGGNDLNFSATLTGRHTIILNRDRSVYYDGTAKLTNLSAGTYSNVYYWIAGRGDKSNVGKVKIYGYKITQISTGNVICNLVPRTVMYGDTVLANALYDTANDAFYMV